MPGAYERNLCWQAVVDSAEGAVLPSSVASSVKKILCYGCVLRGWGISDWEIIDAPAPKDSEAEIFVPGRRDWQARPVYRFMDFGRLNMNSVPTPSVLTTSIFSP